MIYFKENNCNDFEKLKIISNNISINNILQINM